MKIIEPNVKIIKQESGIDGLFEHIEVCGRNCYKSEDKIIDADSAKNFVNILIQKGHTSMLEHGTVYLTMDINSKTRIKKVHYPWYYNNAEAPYDEVFAYVQCLFLTNPYSVVKVHTEDYNVTSKLCITTNYRVIYENGWEDIMKQFMSEPTIYHERRFTLKFTTNIGVSREGNRNRANSIAEESTRYCNYTKEKFGNEITFCKPAWISKEELSNTNLSAMKGEVEQDELPILVYQNALFECQKAYNKLIKLGWTPEQAREVLPLATKTDVIYTATAHQWEHFFDQRLFGKTGKPHPNMKEVCEIAEGELIKNNMWCYLYNIENNG